MVFSELGIGFANLSGFLALIFIIATAAMMSAKSRLFKRYSSHQKLLKNVHVVLASLGGGFLLLHAEYFINAPVLNTGIFLGYLSTVIAIIVWFTGFSSLERLRYSLLYHRSLSLFAISLMVLHTIELGFNISLGISEAVLAIIIVVTFARALQHFHKVLNRKSVEVSP